MRRDGILLAEIVEAGTRILALNPASVLDVLADIERIGQACDEHVNTLLVKTSLNLRLLTAQIRCAQIDKLIRNAQHKQRHREYKVNDSNQHTVERSTLWMAMR